MLDSAYENMPEEILSTERFEVTKVMGHIQGNKTIISNFHSIAQTLSRTPEHACKFNLKEIAAPGSLKANYLIIGRKVSASLINDKIEKYVEEFVICPECKKSDTKLIKEGNYIFMKCLVCGAKHSVKAKI